MFQRKRYSQHTQHFRYMSLSLLRIDRNTEDTKTCNKAHYMASVWCSAVQNSAQWAKHKKFSLKISRKKLNKNIIQVFVPMLTYVVCTRAIYIQSLYHHTEPLSTTHRVFFSIHHSGCTTYYVESFSSIYFLIRSLCFQRQHRL